MLEHLAQPVEALKILRKLLKPGGTLTVIEGDHGLTCFHPDNPAAREAVQCQVDLQKMAGGNALIGRQLHPLMTAAGLNSVRVSPRMVYVDGSKPDWAAGFTRNTFTAMIQGVRGSAVAAGLIDAQRFDMRASEGCCEQRKLTGSSATRFSRASASARSEFTLTALSSTRHAH